MYGWNMNFKRHNLHPTVVGDTRKMINASDISIFASSNTN